MTTLCATDYNLAPGEPPVTPATGRRSWYDFKAEYIAGRVRCGMRSGLTYAGACAREAEDWTAGPEVWARVDALLAAEVAAGVLAGPTVAGPGVRS